MTATATETIATVPEVIAAPVTTVTVTVTRKANVSLICLQTMANDPDRDIELDEFITACKNAGVVFEEMKVYNALQSLASTGKCDRGVAKRTWCAKGSGRPAGVAAPVSTANVTKKSKADSLEIIDPNYRKVAVPRAAKTSFGGLIDQLKATLGRNDRRDYSLAYIIVDDGSEVKSSEYYIAQASNALGQKINSWFTYRGGGVVASHVETADAAADLPGALHIGFCYRENKVKIEADQVSSTVDATEFDGSAETE